MASREVFGYEDVLEVMQEMDPERGEWLLSTQMKETETETETSPAAVATV